jgi:hypothetical protein
MVNDMVRNEVHQANPGSIDSHCLDGGGKFNTGRLTDEACVYLDENDPNYEPQEVVARMKSVALDEPEIVSLMEERVQVL